MFLTKNKHLDNWDNDEVRQKKSSDGTRWNSSIGFYMLTDAMSKLDFFRRELSILFLLIEQN